MNTIRIKILAISLFVCAGIKAQTSYDAARVMGQEMNGTARYIGMGGAMSAFGNDLSVIKSNPAGIGTYKQFDVNFSLSFSGTSTKMTNQGTDLINIYGFNENVKYESKTKKSDIGAAFDNISFVICNESDGFGSLKNVNFAFSYRRLKDIDRSVDYYDDFLDYDEFREYGNNDENKINSYDFNISFNHDDRFYWGFTVGILDASYWSNGYYYHCFYDTPTDKWYDYTAVDRMNEIFGKGFDMALGAIFRPIDNIRLGVSLKTPTWYSMDQRYQDYLYADQGTAKDGELFSQSVSYNVTTPWVMNLSAGLTFENTAIGFEYERNFADRVSLRQSSRKLEDQGSYDLQSYDTYKVGIEQNINKMSIRAGYAVTSTMFKEGQMQYMGDTEFNSYRRDFESDKLGVQRNITFGIGYCSSPSYNGEQFYLDAAYVVGVKKYQLCMGGSDVVYNYPDTYSDGNLLPLPYYPNPFSDYRDITGKFILTAGFYF